MVAVWPIVNGLLAVLCLKQGWSSDGAILFLQGCIILAFLILGLKLISRRSRRVKAEALLLPPPLPPPTEREAPKTPKSTQERLEEGLRVRKAQAESERLIRKAIYVSRHSGGSHPAHRLKIIVTRGDSIKVVVLQEADGQEIEVFKGRRHEMKRVKSAVYYADAVVYDKTIEEYRKAKDIRHEFSERVEDAREEIELFKPGPWQLALEELYAKAKAQEEEREKTAVATQLAAAAARETRLQSIDVRSQSKDNSKIIEEKYAKEIHDFNLTEFLKDEDEEENLDKLRSPSRPD
jgi:hypothetical protein